MHTQLSRSFFPQSRSWPLQQERQRGAGVLGMHISRHLWAYLSALLYCTTQMLHVLQMEGQTLCQQQKNDNSLYCKTCFIAEVWDQTTPSLRYDYINNNQALLILCLPMRLPFSFPPPPFPALPRKKQSGVSVMCPS